MQRTCSAALLANHATARQLAGSGEIARGFDSPRRAIATIPSNGPSSLRKTPDPHLAVLLPAGILGRFANARGQTARLFPPNWFGCAEPAWASLPVAPNGHIYFTSLNDGVVTVLKAGTEKPEVVAKNPELGEKVAATPTIADDTLYVRTNGHFYAFAEE